MSHTDATPTQSTYHVYVIELSDDAGTRIDPTKPCVYVGQSACTPDERFRQHRAGYRAARMPRRYGRYLRRRLYGKFNPLPTREAAEKMEAELAQRLRDRGFTVFGGH